MLGCKWLLKSLRKGKKTRAMKSEKNLSGKGKFGQIFQSGEKISVD